MLIEVKVPQLSESVSEATLVTWHKKEGDAVSRDENLIDIETDKVVLETPAPGDGVIVKIVKGDGETVASGELIAQIDTEAKGAKKADEPASDDKQEKAAPAPAAAESKGAGGSASPAARKILEEKGIAADEVSGSGRGGRVTKQDAVAAEKREAPAQGAAPSTRSVERDAADRPEE